MALISGFWIHPSMLMKAQHNQIYGVAHIRNPLYTVEQACQFLDRRRPVGMESFSHPGIGGVGGACVVEFPILLAW